MRKTLISLAPLAVALVVFLGVLVVLLERNPGLARWSLAIFLFGHGWVHITYLMPQRGPTPQPAGRPSTDNPFNLHRSWLANATAVDGRVLHGAGIALVAVVMVGFSLAALATGGVVVPPGWWAVLVTGSTLASMLLLLLALFFHPALLLGWAINVVVLWFVVVAHWLPSVA